MIIVRFVAKIDLLRFDEFDKKKIRKSKVVKSAAACFVVREEFTGNYADLSEKVLGECGQRFGEFAAEFFGGSVEFGVQISGYTEIESGSGFLLTPFFLKSIAEYSPWIDVDFIESLSS